MHAESARLMGRMLDDGLMVDGPVNGSIDWLLLLGLHTELDGRTHGWMICEVLVQSQLVFCITVDVLLDCLFRFYDVHG